jgi:hypothetical protein
MVIMNQRVIRPDGNKIWLYYTPPDELAGIHDEQPSDKTFDHYFFKYIYPVFCHPEEPFIWNAGQIGLYGSVDSRGWMGHYADTPDERPLIGRPEPDSIENYAVSTGYSGHGIQASIGAALGLTHQILELPGIPFPQIPDIYSAQRDLNVSMADHSRL